VKKTILDYALKVKLPVTVFVILMSFALTYFIAKPEREGVGYAPEQPIKYSHKLHAGDLAIDCKYCHTSVSKTRHASIPAASICMNCHKVARTDKPEIIKLTEYYNENKPIPWKRVHRVPEYAYFNHAAHVTKGIDCANCHGNIREMEVVTQVKSFTMGSCLECHRNPETVMPQMKGAVKAGPTNCNTCHR
jgi:hypothetical protein